MRIGQTCGLGDGSGEARAGFLRDHYLVTYADTRWCGGETTGNGCIGAGVAQLYAITTIGKGTETACAVTADLVAKVVEQAICWIEQVIGSCNRCIETITLITGKCNS